MRKKKSVSFILSVVLIASIAIGAYCVALYYARTQSRSVSSREKESTPFADNEAVNASLSDILRSQRVAAPADIRCGDISEKQFIDLGDAVMGALAGNEKHHQAMEDLMGGENSPLSQAMHERMGAAYLECPASAAFDAPDTLMGNMPTGEGTARAGEGPHLPMIKYSPIAGEYLVDFRGLTLYTFSKDTPGKSSCYGSCAMLWPAYNIPIPPETLSLLYRHLRAFRRRDGSRQMEWKGLPLYFSASDTHEGDMKGEGVEGLWYVARP